MINKIVVIMAWCFMIAYAVAVISMIAYCVGYNDAKSEPITENITQIETGDLTSPMEDQ